MIEFSCKNPQHPSHIPRNKEMKVLEEDAFHVVVACVVCRDYYNAVAAQYITLPRGKERVQHDLDQTRRH
jgi:predicted anti-sigma-YlaC factor YlaD